MSALKAVVESIVQQLPARAGRLSDLAIIEYFPVPAAPYFYGKRFAPREVFAYQFMSEAGLNVATWIPCMSDKPLMHTDNSHSPRGRLYEDKPQGKERITWILEAIGYSNGSTRSLT